MLYSEKRETATYQGTSKSLLRDAWIGTEATDSMIEDDPTRVADLLCLFTEVAQDDLFKHEIRTWDHKESVGFYL